LSAQSVDALGEATAEAPGIWRRMACWAYEGLLLFGVVFIAGYLFSTLSQTRHALDNRHALQAFVFVIFGIYFVWFWSKGQTLAMKTWNIRVVDVHGLNLPGKEAAVITLGWIAVWAILSRFHPQRQFWHDALAGTRLVTTEPGRSQ
jgi:uncharacterized RDD family membrane protein YckC